ncbi:MAG: DUF4476 domain-containing protein [Chlorobi bacterium]|nr:DUF4476 domain-containing protein [Chlorobiota bacterium]
MKKTLALLIIIANLVNNSFSQVPYSVLTFFSEEKIPFTVILNGVYKNSIPTTNVKIEGLTNPVYEVKIIFEDKTLAPLNKTVNTKQGFELTYVIKKDEKGNNALNYFSEAVLPPDYAEPAYRNNDMTMPGNPEEIKDDINKPENKIPDDNATENPDIKPDINNDDIPQDINLNEDKKHYEPAEYPSAMPDNMQKNCNMPPSSEKFLEIKKTLSKASSDSDKLIIAEQILNDNCFTARQVKEAALLFNFEKYRLQFAKLAYKHTFDTDNYLIIKDIFKFSSSVRELEEYINSSK